MDCGDKFCRKVTTSTFDAAVCSLTPDPDPVCAGGTLTYSLTVTNKGPDQASSVTVTDALPAGVTFNSDLGIFRACGMGSPGFDELRWLKPVRPGDTLHSELEVVEKTPSRSKPDRGMLRVKYRIKNQRGEDVTTFTSMHLTRRCPT